MPGRFRSTIRESYGGVMVLRADAEQAAKLMQDDPAVKAGLLKTEIDPWITGKGVLELGRPQQ